MDTIAIYLVSTTILITLLIIYIIYLQYHMQREREAYIQALTHENLQDIKPSVLLENKREEVVERKSEDEIPLESISDEQFETAIRKSMT